MSDDKPLHVRTYEALGYRHEPHPLPDWVSARRIDAWGYAPDGSHMLEPPPDFTRSWADTGPLIEKYGISLMRHRQSRHNHPGWSANAGEGPDTTGKSALEAACNLILALKEAGKL